MSTNYTALQVKAATMLSKYGQEWTVLRNGVSVGRLNGLKTKADTSAVKSGLMQASAPTVELIVEATPTVKPGDILRADHAQYIVTKVEKIEPTSTTIVQKVSAV